MHQSHTFVSILVSFKPHFLLTNRGSSPVSQQLQLITVTPMYFISLLGDKSKTL